MEVGDHCFGSYSLLVVDGKNCVIPDYTLPSFYDVKGVAPFTNLNAVKAPFTMTPKGYGYWIDRKTGKLVKI